MTDTYSPAETVEMSGFTLDTLRYYERIGLILAAAGPAMISGRSR